MRIVSYNVEWFVSLFDRRGRLLSDDLPSARYGVSRRAQAEALGRVFQALDADAVMVIEAPDDNILRRRTTHMLEAFAERFGLRARKALLGFANDTQQEIALMYDPDRLSVRHDPRGEPGPPAPGKPAPRFDSWTQIDLNIDGRVDTVTFSKPPLEIAARTAGGTALRMIGVHIKSKAPHGATSPDDERRLAIENRRKQMAQCLWLRDRVLEHLAAGESLIVLGDFNDGPGLDSYEKLFGRSGLEIVLGWDEPHATRMFDPHGRAVLGKKLAAAPASSRFFLPEEGHFFSAMLDYVMVSPDLRARGPHWRIWHPFDDPACYTDPALREALLTASDHFPVSLDIDI